VKDEISRVRSCGIYGGENGTRAGWYLGTSISPGNSHSENYFIFINNPIMVLTLTVSLNNRTTNKIIIKN
jgi:hypothetical protein